MTAKEIVAQMTLEEKAGLCSGKDFWHLKSVERLGLSSIMVTDGPHGLRKQAESADHLGLNDSVPATCFPVACATASSFDRALLRRMGQALGEECHEQEVSVLLGPGLNIKRSPLCGRNFEYFSEDPYLAGELAVAVTQGVQAQQVGTSVKHYAANNQETRRMTADSVVDERALREIYLAGFEKVVKEAQPWTVMCSYNRLYGVYLSDSKRMLWDILREEWGFEGLVMTDWGAMNDRVEGVRAGLDLEMPGGSGYNDAKIIAAVNAGQLRAEDLDKAVVRVVDLILKSQEAKKASIPCDMEAHHALAREIAAASCVLLKNEDGVLPLSATGSLAVIGGFAKTPRYQGTGSSKVNPVHLESACDVLAAEGVAFSYAEGYSLTRHSAPDEALIQQACEAAKGKETVLLFAGLPDEYESEGYDRTHLDMPQSHNRLIEAVAAVNPNVVVVLQCGAPVVMPWLDKVKAVLLAYLGGQAGGGGCVDVLFGRAEAGGRLAETFPAGLSDTPCAAYFPGGTRTVEYRESIFVGYRYYDAAQKQVVYPFGYGLSYTSFAYSGLQISHKRFTAGKTETVQVTCTVKNTGERAGCDVVQLYIAGPAGKVFRALKELKGFEKVHLAAGESKEVTFLLDERSFAYYNAPAGQWAVESGLYGVQIGASSRDIRLQDTVDVEGDGKEDLLAELQVKAPVYYHLPTADLRVEDAQFEALLGRPIPPAEYAAGEAFTLNSTIQDLQRSFMGRIVRGEIIRRAKGMLGGDMDEATMDMSSAMLLEMPLRSMALFAPQAVTPTMLEGVVDIANGKLFRGLRKLRAPK